MEIQGHRGSRGTRPENTLPSFLAGIEAGADALELDVMTTKDGVIIVHHDFWVNGSLCQWNDGRPVSDKRLIRTLNLAEIKQLDCGSKGNSKFPCQVPVPGAQIPTLEELLILIQKCPHPNAKKIRLNIEIKRDSRHHEMAKRLVLVVKGGGFSDRVYYSSFDLASILAVREVDPNAKIGLVFGKKDSLSEVLEIATKHRLDVLSPELAALNAESIQKVKLVCRVIPWTVNDPKQWKELVQMGVDGIITDYPEALVNFSF